MKGKKAFELSATFLVMLILIIVIFVGAIYFTQKFFATAQEMRAEIEADTEAEIEALLYQGGDLVAMPKFKKKIQRGKGDTFGLGIRNILDESKDFYVHIAFTNAFTVNEELITGTSPSFIDSKWLLYSQGPYTIQNNELQLIPVLANVNLEMGEGITTEEGIYSFNVCIFKGDVGQSINDMDTVQCSAPHKNLIPTNVYGGKVLKMYVEVV